MEEDALSAEVFNAIASLALVDAINRHSPLTGPPLNLTGPGLAVLTVKLSRIAVAHGGAPVSLADVKTAKTAGGCVDLVRRQLPR